MIKNKYVLNSGDNQRFNFGEKERKNESWNGI